LACISRIERVYLRQKFETGKETEIDPASVCPVRQLFPLYRVSRLCAESLPGILRQLKRKEFGKFVVPALPVPGSIRQQTVGGTLRLCPLSFLGGQSKAAT
jgi:hypothetical protein